MATKKKRQLHLFKPKPAIDYDVVKAINAKFQHGAMVYYYREYTHCGRKACHKQHGPYWHAYIKPVNDAAGKRRKVYIGKTRRDVTRAEVRKALQLIRGAA